MRVCEEDELNLWGRRAQISCHWGMRECADDGLNLCGRRAQTLCLWGMRLCEEGDLTLNDPVACTPVRKVSSIFLRHCDSPACEKMSSNFMPLGHVYS